jgi:hypothetical protein
MPKPILILLWLALAISASGQVPPVFSSSRQVFDFPWAGGMNSCQFGKIDIDRDGIKDLVVFDRMGNRIMPFLVVPSGESYTYQYAPQYVANFPALAQWVIFADYNLDGKEDIFTYSPGYAGMKVYKNVSTDKLEFRLEVFPYLKSFQGGGYVNILVTYADYPAIADLDDDGDLDILTFYGLGAFVEKHRNMSVEKYGNADSLDFEKTESCWGFFAEGIESNAITLDTCLRCMEAGRQGSLEAGKQGCQTADRRPLTADRHTGSTFRILDLNADDLPDLLLGDVDYPNLVALHNGGTIDTARMISYDWEYPAGNQPVKLFTMPEAYYDDYDFDGIKDLLVAPFDPNPFLPENFRSNWLYHNNGADNQPQFSLVSTSFLQDRMLDFGSGAYPAFFDVDNDGLIDLFVGNYGYYDTSYYDNNNFLKTINVSALAYLRNTGSASHPAFTLIYRDFSGLSALNLTGLVPAFGDLDGDGDADMLLGSEEGRLRYYENTAGQGNTPDYQLADEFYQGINPGTYSVPQLFDLDEDNLIDLVIGEKGGNINYYRNTGSLQNPVFNLATDSLGRINVTDPDVSLDGYSTPSFYRDNSGNTHLVVGSEQGEVFYYTGIDDNIFGKYERSDTLCGLLGLADCPSAFGYRSAPELADLDQDGIPELVVGNFSGGLNYLGKNAQSPVNQLSENDGNTDDLVSVFPNPANDIVLISYLSSLDKELKNIKLIDFTGRIFVDSENIKGKTIEIQTRDIPAGIYLLKISLGNTSGVQNPVIVSKKLIVIH